MIFPLKSPYRRETLQFDSKGQDPADDFSSSATASASEGEESSSVESFEILSGKVRFDLDVLAYLPREDIGWNDVKALCWIRKQDIVLARRRAIRDCVRYQQGSEYRDAVNMLRRRLPYMVVDTDVVEHHEILDNTFCEDETTARLVDEKAKEAAIEIITQDQRARGLERYALGLGPRREHIFCVLETQSMLANRPFEERAYAVAQASRATSEASVDWAGKLGIKDASDVLRSAVNEMEIEPDVFIPRLSSRAGAQGEIVQSLEL